MYRVMYLYAFNAFIYTYKHVHEMLYVLKIYSFISCFSV